MRRAYVQRRIHEDASRAIQGVEGSRPRPARLVHEDVALPDKSLEVYNRISAPGFCVLVLKPYGKRHSDTSVHI